MDILAGINTVFEIRGNNHCGRGNQCWKITPPQWLFPLISNTGIIFTFYVLFILAWWWEFNNMLDPITSFNESSSFRILNDQWSYYIFIGSQYRIDRWNNCKGSLVNILTSEQNLEMCTVPGRFILVVVHLCFDTVVEHSLLIQGWHRLESQGE